jgi:hypothetical protein
MQKEPEFWGVYGFLSEVRRPCRYQGRSRGVDTGADEDLPLRVAATTPPGRRRLQWQE